MKQANDPQHSQLRRACFSQLELGEAHCSHSFSLVWPEDYFCAGDSGDFFSCAGRRTNSSPNGWPAGLLHGFLAPFLFLWVCVACLLSSCLFFCFSCFMLIYVFLCLCSFICFCLFVVLCVVCSASSSSLFLALGIYLLLFFGCYVFSCGVLHVVSCFVIFGCVFVYLVSVISICFLTVFCISCFICRSMYLFTYYSLIPYVSFVLLSFCLSLFMYLLSFVYLSFLL